MSGRVVSFFFFFFYLAFGLGTAYSWHLCQAIVCDMNLKPPGIIVTVLPN